MTLLFINQLKVKQLLLKKNKNSDNREQEELISNAPLWA